MSPREVAPAEASPRQVESVSSRDTDNSLLEADGDNICLQRESSSAQSQPVLASNSQTEAETSAAWPISTDGPHEITQPRRWLARQLMDSMHTAEEAFSIVAYHPAIQKAAPRYWLPIDTAPKDGSVILLCSGPWQPCAGLWFTPPEDLIGPARQPRWVSFDPEGTFEEDTQLADYLDGTSYDPTHWMPLPEPPEGAS